MARARMPRLLSLDNMSEPFKLTHEFGYASSRTWTMDVTLPVPLY